MSDRTDLATIVTWTNPVPDPTAAGEYFDAHQSILTLIDEKVRAADVQQHLHGPAKPAPYRQSRLRNWVVALGTASAVLVLIGGLVWLVGGLNSATVGDPAATTIPPTTAATPIQPPDIVFERAMNDAWNGRDLDTYESFFAADAFFDGRRMRSDVNRTMLRFLMAAGWRSTAEDCVRAPPNIITCSGTISDDLHGPAGLSFPFERRIVLDDSGLVASLTNDLDVTGMDEFNDAFDAWLTTAHPDIQAKEYLINYALSDPMAVTEAIAVVDEFLAWSDDYPIDRGDATD
jgi:hypothetical protein